MEELLDFMMVFRANDVAYVSKDIEIPKDTCGITFKVKDSLKGIVVFGSQYPLNGLDLPLKSHINVYRAIKETGAKSFGSAFEDDNGKFIYYDKDLKKFV